MLQNDCQVAWKKLISHLERLKRKIQLDYRDVWIQNMKRAKMEKRMGQSMAMVSFVHILKQWRVSRVSRCLSRWAQMALLYEQNCCLEIQWRHELLKRDNQFAGISKSKSQAMLPSFFGCLRATDQHRHSIAEAKVKIESESQSAFRIP